MKKKHFQFLSEFLIYWMTLPMRTFLLLGIKPWPRTSIRNISCWKRLSFFIITSLTKYWFVNASYSHKSYDNNIFIFPLKNINGKLSIYSQEWERRESAIPPRTARTPVGDRCCVCVGACVWGRACRLRACCGWWMLPPLVGFVRQQERPVIELTISKFIY